jgi:hypothetical protein
MSGFVDINIVKYLRSNMGVSEQLCKGCAL